MAASVLVIVGVILEGEELIREYKERGWRPVWPKIGFMLLVAGLAFEVFFQSKIESMDAALKRESDIKIATAQNSAAQARLEGERLKARVLWRSVSAWQCAAIGGGTGNGHGIVEFEYPLGDPEALFLVIALSHCFDSAKWQISGVAVTLQNVLPSGLYITGPIGADLESVRSAFAAGKINFSPTDPTEGESFIAHGRLPGPDAVRIFVGSRPQL